MISDKEIERVAQQSAKFKRAIIDVKYDAAMDRIEFVLSWCTLTIRRKEIDELRDISPDDMSKIHVSAVGIHIDSADIDINAAGCMIEILDKLKEELGESY